MTETQVDTLWYTRCSVPTPFSFAAQFGWFEEEFAPDGLAVKSLRESSNPEELASHFEHNLPNSFRQGGSVPAIWARSKGQDTRVIALTWTDEHQAIVALPRAGIRSPRDLRGRKIGIPKHNITIDHNRASAFRAFELVLAAEGLSLSDVELVDLTDDHRPEDGGVRRGLSRDDRRRHSYTNEAHALATGAVDAVYVKDVRGLDLAHILGAVVVADIGFHPDPFIRISNCAPRPLTVSADLLEARPDLVERFLARVVAAGEWARHDPDGAVRGIASETGWSERSVRRAFGPSVHEHLGADLAPASIEGLGQFVDYLAANSFIPNGFDVAAWIDPGPLERLARRTSSTASARPAAVAAA